nr:hypothetical protein [Propioniciclava sp. MC1683]
MIAEPPTSATATAGRPVARAGSMKPKKIAPATPSPIRPRTPFQPATAMTTTTKASVNRARGSRRSMVTSA